MTGEELYNMYQEGLSRHKIYHSDWGDLSSRLQSTWNDLAELLDTTYATNPQQEPTNVMKCWYRGPEHPWRAGRLHAWSQLLDTDGPVPIGVVEDIEDGCVHPVYVKFICLAETPPENKL